jgi:D-alanyl-D-alanine carboxypeptidase (penicillin-binding protein 5/6)
MILRRTTHTCLLLACSAVLGWTCRAWAGDRPRPPEVTARAWLVADPHSGEVLAEHHSAEPRAIASLTKLMTAWIVAQQAADDPRVLEQVLSVSAAADATPGTSAGLKQGERLTVRDALYALLLPSGNDAAVALAEHFGPQFAGADADAPPDASDRMARFVAEMNRQARALGLRHTSYANPHGLDAAGHVSTAADLALLVAAVLQHEVLQKVVATRTYRGTLLGAQGSRRTATWANTNRLLAVEGFDGVKTGTTSNAGACLACSQTRDGRRLVVIVLGCTSNDARYADSRALLNWAWAVFGSSMAAGSSK